MTSYSAMQLLQVDYIYFHHLITKVPGLPIYLITSMLLLICQDQQMANVANNHLHMGAEVEAVVLCYCYALKYMPQLHHSHHFMTFHTNSSPSSIYMLSPSSNYPASFPLYNLLLNGRFVI